MGGTTMPAVAPMLMDSKTFLRETTPRNPLKRGRSSLRDIDLLLSRCDKLSVLQPAERMQILVGLCRALRAWLTKKEGKTTGNSEFRRAAIVRLGNQAFARLQYEDFQRHKTNFNSSQARPVKSLAPGYMNERLHYVNNNKQFAYSGSQLRVLVQGGDTFGVQGVTSFDQLTLQQFDAIGRAYGQMSNDYELKVKFFNKQEKTTSLIYVEDGYLIQDGNRKLTADQGAEFMYAIDKYGNILGVSLEAGHKMAGNSVRFNHSSLNAGKDVICAGMLRCQDGRLKYIDNASGHYAPTKQNLIEALQFLEENHVDLFASVQVGVLEPDPSRPGSLMMNIYNNAAYFVRNPNAQPSDSYPV